MRKKIIKKECRHRNLENLNEYRKNYPYGKKSKPTYSFKRTYAKKCKRCGKIFKI